MQQILRRPWFIKKVMTKIVLLVFFGLLTAKLTHEIQDFRGTELKKCIDCLCHARSGCWSRFNCARYSVNFNYWKRAGSPVIDPNHDPDSQMAYEKCMTDENCIVATIVQYTESFGQLDCNCDGVFDCKDRFAIHLKGVECFNPTFGNTYASRFNHCATSIGLKPLLAKEGSDDCAPEVF